MTRGAVQTLTDTAFFVVFHPVRSGLRVLGVVKGVAETVTGRGWASEPVPPPAPAPVSVVPPQRVPDREPQPAAEQVPPAEPHESFATEPSGLEDWQDEVAAEAQDRDVVEPDPWQEPAADEPLLDPSLTKQVKGDLDRGLRDAEQ